MKPISLGVLVIAWVSLCGLGAPAPAWATSTEAGGPAKAGVPWAGKEYDECGQRCVFERANENIGLQAIYLVRKIQRLKGVGDSERLSELGDFCMPTDDGDSCFDRYKTVQVRNLYAMRKAMIDNSLVIAELSGKGKKQATALARSRDGKLKKPQVPFVITFEDLQKEHATLKTLTSEQYHRYVEELPREPSRDEFRKIREIPRDPDNPEAGKLTVVGDVDEKAYQQALAKFRSETEQQHLKATVDHYRRNQPSPARKSMPSDGSESRQAFDEARRAFVDTANDMIGKPTRQSKDPARVGKNEGVKIDVASGAQKAAPAASTGRRSKKGEILVHDVEAKADNQGNSMTVTVHPDELLQIIQKL
ncbi:MAG: hypothetical protein NDJ90_15120 [Oligoflexia bacterium]|nr:hypothetical protein [Oligoflexia bacterium]